MNKYWFRFNLTIDQCPPLGTLLGCGVTAASKDEAIQLLKDRVFNTMQFPDIRECTENIDIHTLDRNHVRPNMGDPERFGIWFPLGYEVAER